MRARTPRPLGWAVSSVAIAATLLASCATLAACSAEGEATAVETADGEDAPAAAAAPEAIEAAAPEPSTSWPRPVPPTPSYAEIEVTDPTRIHGTVTAAVEGVGPVYEAEEPDGCPAAPPAYPAGPLAGAVVRLQGVAEGAPLAERAGSEGGPTATLGSCALEPRVQLASLNSVLRLTASDGQDHEVQMIEAAGYRDLGRFTAAATGDTERRLRVPGLVHLRCETHPGARGWIWVTEHPYVALTGADGTFAIENVPAGRYVLHVWHEAFASTMQEVELASGAALRTDVALQP